jgi:hypothetical protein
MAEAPDPKQRHPKSSYKADYYFNKKSVTESGHEMEWDDTKGAERIRIAHRTGSYIEWSADGRKVESIKSHEHKYVQGGLTQTVDNNSDYKYNGNLRKSVGSDSHTEISGDTTVVIGGIHSITVKNDYDLITPSDVYIICKNITIKASENMNIDCGGDFAVNALGAINLRGATVSIEANVGEMNTKSQGDTIMVAPNIRLNP